MSGREQARWQRSGKTPLFLAQLDLKKAFDHVQHSFATTGPQQKGASEQLLSVLNKWSNQSDIAVSLAAITGHKRISFQRGLPQSRLQCLWLFLIMSWGTWMLGGETENRNINWKMDNIHFTSIAYADDMCLLASSIKDLELRVKECIAGFLAACLETGLDKTFWTITTRSPNATLNIDEHTISCAEKITHVGAKIRVCSNSGSAMTIRLQKATGVFEKWSSILCETTLDLSKRILCFRASVLSSLGWPGPLPKKQESHLASWGARLRARMLGVREPEEDIGSFWMRIHRMGHQCMKQHNTSPVSSSRVQKHRMAAHFARLDDSHIVAKTLRPVP